MNFLLRSGIAIGVLILFLQVVPVTSAHFLRMSEGIGVTLHVEPDDDPASGERTALTFDFKDSEGEFQIKDCDCRVNLLQDGKWIETQLVEIVTESADVHLGRVWVTFPERGVYTIQITGDPFVAEQFRPFMSEFDIRVQRVAPKTEEPKQAGLSSMRKSSTYLIGGVLAVIFIGSFVYFQIIQPRVISRKGV